MSLDARGYLEAATGAVMVATRLFWALGYNQVESYLTQRDVLHEVGLEAAKAVRAVDIRVVVEADPVGAAPAGVARRGPPVDAGAGRRVDEAGAGTKTRDRDRGEALLDRRSPAGSLRRFVVLLGDRAVEDDPRDGADVSVPPA